ncbi:MAG: hypothetical protein EAY75_17415 [Bacteroidetes bacterium]|nr:MAG: hypothetical protein EAY75_17415 [Bacteroidota bacterium]
MKLSLLTLLAFVALGSAAQEADYKKKPTLLLTFGAQDFKTAQLIRSNTLSSVLSNKQWSGITEMDPSFGVTFINGLSQNLDYSVNLSGASINYPYRDKNRLAGSDAFLFETDASLHAKLLSDKYIMVPYLSAGIGCSIYKSFWDAFVPVGLGLQFKLGPDNFITTNAQYRVPITQRANYHFFYNIGFGMTLGKK